MNYRNRLLVFAIVVVALSGCLSTLPTALDVNGPLPATLPPIAQTLQATTAAITVSPAPSLAVPGSPSVATVPVIVATAQPTATLAPTATPAPAPTLVLPTLPALSNEERWRAQQLERKVFPQLRLYRANGTPLYWYDPVNEQPVVLGILNGEFTAQASFILRFSNEPALEVPYQVNQSYGISALSPVILERIHNAGYDQWIEAYVILTDNVQPKE